MSEAGLFSKCVMLVYDKTGLWRRVWWSWWLWQLCKCVMLIYESKRQDFIPAAMVNHQYQDKDQRYDQRLLALSTTLSNVHFPSKTQESCLVKTPKLLKDRFWMPCHSPDRNVWFHEPSPILWDILIDFASSRSLNNLSAAAAHCSPSVYNCCCCCCCCCNQSKRTSSHGTKNCCCC